MQRVRVPAVPDAARPAFALGESLCRVITRKLVDGAFRAHVYADRSSVDDLEPVRTVRIQLELSVCVRAAVRSVRRAEDVAGGKARPS